ncbi:serine hydrolase domain-containing protein [Streptomyces sp. NPDC051976]|uniref:serine hydrolase domain-containing protein n=1 Tax=Streptomyces sp. NPDC051976 TaxID=3154947 RepID=UPI003432B953
MTGYAPHPDESDPAAEASEAAEAVAAGYGGAAPPDDDGTGARLDELVRGVDAPDVVLAVSRRGRRTVRCGGRAAPPPVPRDRARYELGSASKVFTGLLLAHLADTGVLSAAAPAASFLAPERPAARHPITLTHLITHTSGLPPLPADFYPQAVRRWATNPYGHYSSDRVISAFLRARPRHRPGAHWRYSNFGVATLGHALAAATGTPWERLLTERLLRPLGLPDTAARPASRAVDATGHRADGRTPTPPLDVGGFQAAGAVRATPYELLTFLEAHLLPDGLPLEGALRAVQRPYLRRGFGHRHEHTLTWFRHPAPGGPVCFHAGATSGQQAFLGFQPDTGTAVVALSTRRFRRADALVPTAYALLTSAH